jgi:DNA-binding GntR family transcriptional regulator
MTEIDPIGNPDYTYVQAADAIAARIEAGEITHRLPAERTLARELEVAYQTLRHSMKVLRDRGLIITRQGRGTFVVALVRRDDSSGELMSAASAASRPPAASMKPGLADVMAG